MTNLTANIDIPTGNLENSSLLNSHRMPLPATFSFKSFGMPFDVSIHRGAEGGANLVVRGNLGNIPYSAESPSAREFALSIVEAGHHLPMVNISVDRKQAIIALGTLNFPTIPSPASVAAGAAAIAIAIKPVCDVIAKIQVLRA